MANAIYTSVAASTNANTLAPANTRRTELIITNTSTATLYVGIGRVSAGNYMVALPYQGTFVTSITDTIKGYWASTASGQANVTEVY